MAREVSMLLLLPPTTLLGSVNQGSSRHQCFHVSERVKHAKTARANNRQNGNAAGLPRDTHSCPCLDHSFPTQMPLHLVLLLVLLHLAAVLLLLLRRRQLYQLLLPRALLLPLLLLRLLLMLCRMSRKVPPPLM